MSEVFISYVHQDTDTVSRLAKLLERNGINVWLDLERLTPGIRWKVAIAKAIRNGTFFLSIHSVAREQRDKSYVNEELTVAIEEIRKRPINKPWLIPISLDGSSIEDRPIGGGESLLDLQYCDLSDWEPGTKRLLETLGVSDPVLEKDPPEKGLNKHKRSFVAPYSTVGDVLRAMTEISATHGSAKIPRAEAIARFSNNVVKDMSSLGVVQADYTDETIRLVNPHGDQEFALSVAVAKTPAFQVALDVLKEDLDASSASIGSAVSEAFDRDWSTASKQRNGQALRKWAFLLYPNLRSPRLGEKAYLYAAALEPKKKSKGPPRLLSEEMLKIAAQELEPSVNAKRIAELLSVFAETVRRYKRSNPAAWARIFKS